MCPSAPGGQKPVLSLSLDLIQNLICVLRYLLLCCIQYRIMLNRGITASVGTMQRFGVRVRSSPLKEFQRRLKDSTRNICLVLLKLHSLQAHPIRRDRLFFLKWPGKYVRHGLGFDVTQAYFARGKYWYSTITFTRLNWLPTTRE